MLGFVHFFVASSAVILAFSLKVTASPIAAQLPKTWLERFSPFARSSRSRHRGTHDLSLNPRPLRSCKAAYDPSYRADHAIDGNRKEKRDKHPSHPVRPAAVWRMQVDERKEAADH
jgi:hypothetical protein